MGIAAGNTNVMDRGADQAAGVRDQHDVVVLLNWGRGNHWAVTVGGLDIDDALAAPSRYPVFIGRCTLAIAVFGDGEDILFGCRHGLGLFRRAGQGFTGARAFPLPFGPAAGIGPAQIAFPGVAFIISMAQDRHGDQFVIANQANAADANAVAAFEHAHVDHGEADALAPPARQQNIVVGIANSHAHDTVALGQLHGNLAVGLHAPEIGQIVAPHGTRCGGEHDISVGPFRLVLRQGQYGMNGFALFQREQVHHGLAACLGCRHGQAEDFQQINLAGGGEEQHRRMGIGHEKLADEILVPGGHALAPLAPPPLRPVGGKRHPFDIAVVRDGHHHILALDQVLVLLVRLGLDDFTAPGRCEAFLHVQQFFADDVFQAVLRLQDIKVVEDLLAQLPQLFANFIPAQGGQALQAQIQNGPGLNFTQSIDAIDNPVPGFIDQLDHGLHLPRRPIPLHQLGPGGCRVRGGADQGDNGIDIRHGNRQAGQHMGPLPRLAQQIFGAPGDHHFAAVDKGGDHLGQVHQFRPAPVQGQAVDPEGCLQGREAEQLVQHHIGHGIAL